MALQLDENITVLALLERIATTLERIELVLEEKQNKTMGAKETRQLMQNICKHYKETQPSINVEVGSRLQVFRLRDAVSKIKNVQNTRRQNRTLNKWIRLLESREFIARTSDSTYEVLDTGQDWGEL